jgi:malate dehydrogenase (quinone)
VTSSVEAEVVDVALIGAGIMSATLGTLLRKLDPALRIAVFERLDTAAAESSDAWNNAGTGHAGYCELNYTPQRADGSMDITKAVHIGAQFARSLELWRELVRAGELPDAHAFIRAVPHVSFVRGADDVAFLKARHAALVQTPWFSSMELSEDRACIAEWIPLVMDGAAAGPVAATRVEHGTDVDFGALTRGMMHALMKAPQVAVRFSSEVQALTRDGDGWRLSVRDLNRGEEHSVSARFVFIGAGGYSLSLLEKSGIPEAQGYGAFPVSGQWLRCHNEQVIERHHAKVYGKAEVGAPPMSVPHLDTRFVDGNKALLFGPYAGFTTKFLKQGSWLDLLRSIGVNNVVPVMSAGLENIDLTRYLVGQAMLSVDERVALLRKYCPTASADDWQVQVAGLRVQIIKSDGHGRGELKFGTEVVTSADGTLAALLGASPGASTAVAIMLELLERCFPARWASPAWRASLARLLPSLP